MSLIWLDGFENTSLWTANYSQTGSPASVAGRTNNCFRATSLDYLTKVLPSADEHATIIFGAAMKLDSVGNTTTMVELRSDTNATAHTELAIVAGGELRATRGGGGTTLGTTTGLGLTSGTFYFIEAKFVLNDTTGSVVVKVNGTTALNLTSVDTKNGGTKSVYDSIKFKGIGSTTNIYYDDLYILNGAGSAYNDFLGDGTVQTIRPDGNGTTSDFTGSDGNSTDNYLLVDEATYDGADYTTATAANQKDLYTFGDISGSGTVKGVVVKPIISRTAPGTSQVRSITRISSTNYNGSTITLDGSALPRNQVWETSPATSADWTVSELNGAQFGVESL